MNALRLIDTHRHVWDTRGGHLTYSWLDRLPRLQGRFTPDKVGAPYGECFEVSGAVFVEAGCDQEAAAELAWVRALPWGDVPLLGCVAKLDATRPDIDEHLVDLGGPAGATADPPVERTLAPSAGPVVGVRDILQGAPPERFADPALDRGLRAVAAAGLTFDLCITHDQLPHAIGLLERHPDLTVIVDHLAKPPVEADARAGADPAHGAWAANLARLASLPQTHVKLSGLSPEAGQLSGTPHWDDLARRYLDVAFEAFGPRRSLFGSDWPVSHANFDRPLAYEDWPQTVFGVALAGVSRGDLEAVASGTALRCYGLQPTASAAL
ncbi:amidohydrolase family protein [Micrococcales bacterium 31B]|nr:amidohydrolase family protein [Micrococcales bacterium 31B]